MFFFYLWITICAAAVVVFDFFVSLWWHLPKYRIMNNGQRDISDRKEILLTEKIENGEFLARKTDEMRSVYDGSRCQNEKTLRTVRSSFRAVERLDTGRLRDGCKTVRNTVSTQTDKFNPFSASFIIVYRLNVPVFTLRTVQKLVEMDIRFHWPG